MTAESGQANIKLDKTLELISPFKEVGLREAKNDYLLESFQFPATIISFAIALRILQYKVEVYLENKAKIRAKLEKERQISSLQDEIEKFTSDKSKEIEKIQK